MSTVVWGLSAAAEVGAGSEEMCLGCYHGRDESCCPGDSRAQVLATEQTGIQGQHWAGRVFNTGCCRVHILPMCIYNFH